MRWKQVGVGCCASGARHRYEVSPASHTQLLIRQFDATGKATRRERVERERGLAAGRVIAELWEREQS